jgi:hypothetical protein
MRLRAAYDAGLADGSIQTCGCNQPDCSTHAIHDDTALKMDTERSALLLVSPGALPDPHPGQPN